MRTERTYSRYYLVAAGLLVLAGVAVIYFMAADPKPVNDPVIDPQIQAPANSDTSSPAQALSPDVNEPDSVSTPEKKTSSSTMIFLEPIDNALQRITKKPFGIYVSPKSSPVSPEKFSGYHTGVDFEIFPGEEDTEVLVNAICDGELVEKRRASGYGGIAVLECRFGNQYITVIYGHLKLSSIGTKVGDTLKSGEKIGILGKGYTAETDGERKHLHLGVHKGKTFNIKGYVADNNELKNWLDAAKYIK